MLVKQIDRALAPVLQELDNTLAEAQNLAFDAWDLPDDAARLAAAGAILRVSPCRADAWVMLAQAAPPASELALELWMNGVAYGAAGIGARFLEQGAGDFWGILETRPYMRARAGLAEALWQRGRLA